MPRRFRSLEQFLEGRGDIRASLLIYLQLARVCPSLVHHGSSLIPDEAGPTLAETVCNGGG